MTREQIQPASAHAPARLSAELRALETAFAERPVLLGEIVSVTHGRGYLMLLILMALPFCTPVPLPGLSTPLGLVVALVGFRLALRQQPWLPARLLGTVLPAGLFRRLFAAARRLVSGLEWFLKPRGVRLVDSSALHHVYGAIICVCGLLLLLPLPLPLTNALPALTVVLLAAALLERDGLCLVLALLLFAVTAAYFGALLLGGTMAVDWLLTWWNAPATASK